MKRALLFLAFGAILMFSAAVSAAAQASVAGEWSGSFETPGGPRPLTIVLNVDGEKLSGTIKRQSGDVPLTGTIKGADIAFAYTINYNGNDLTMSFAGKVSGDEMGGTVSFGSSGSQEAWTAKRKPVEKPKQ